MQKQRYAFVIYSEAMRAHEYIYRCSDAVSAGNVVAAPTNNGKYFSLALVTRIEYLSDAELPIDKSRILYLDKPLTLRDEAYVFDNIAFMKAAVNKYPPTGWERYRNEENWLAYYSNAIKSDITYEYDDGTVFLDYGDYKKEGSFCDFTITGSDNIELKIAYIESLMDLLSVNKITPVQFDILKEHVNGAGYYRRSNALKHKSPTPILGLKRGTVTLLPHCTEWPGIAADIIAGLKEYFDGFAIDVQHVGSTAINGICAKPIIDIAVGVENINYILHYIDKLYNIGVHFRGSDVPGQLLFVTGDIENNIRTAHIHIVKHGGDTWNNYINFRDYLNAFPDKAHEYDALKKRLAGEYDGDRGAYSNAKQAFIDEICKKAAVWRKASS